MTYLNSKIKDAIVENALKLAGIPTKDEALVKRRAEWAEAVRVDALGGEKEAVKIEKLNARFKKMLEEIPEAIRPSEALRQDYDIWLNVGGARFHAQFSGKLKDDFKGRVFRVTPSGHTLKAGSPLADEFAAIEAAHAALVEESQTIQSNVRAALNRVRTVKKLLEEWSEAKVLLPTDLDEARVRLPAIRREALNEMIGLPA